MHLQFIQCDAIEKGFERISSGLITRKREHGLQEGLLGKVIGELPFTGTTQDETEDRPEVQLIEGRKGLRPAFGLRYQGFFLVPIHLLSTTAMPTGL